jgi:hydrogenase-1 operon protein HyaF
MNIADIPVRVIGPGSQPGESDGQALTYIDMPSDMATFEPPPMPEGGDYSAFTGAREAALWLAEALRDYEHGGDPLLADLTALDGANRDLVNQILVEGEVSVTRSGTLEARSQEAALAGVWRTLYLDRESRVVRDILEVGDVPHIVRLKEETGGDPETLVPDVESLPEGVVNALPILVEIEEHCARYRETGDPHSINLSLLPLTEEDQVYLDERLGPATLDTLSRAYGKCSVRNTGVPDVWWVRFYNSMGTLILNTLEIVGVPEVLRAAPEDLADSRERLDAILAPYWPLS